MTFRRVRHWVHSVKSNVKLYYNIYVALLFRRVYLNHLNFYIVYPYGLCVRRFIVLSSLFDYFEF